MVQADICKYIILPDTDRKKGDLQYPHPNVVHRPLSRPLTRAWNLVQNEFPQPHNLSPALPVTLMDTFHQR